MVTLGLASVVFAALMLYRRQDIKRLFAYSSIEHMGVITFAFGMGGTLANFAGLLHMVLHSLTKSAIFFCVGHVAQVKGTQRMAEIRGLTVSHPTLGWSLGLGVVAIAGLPPMGLFMTEFLIVTTTFARAPALAIILGVALLVGLGALLLRLNGLAFGDPDGRSDPDTASFLPIGLHLAIVLAAGIWLPPALVAWFHTSRACSTNALAIRLRRCARLDRHRGTAACGRDAYRAGPSPEPRTWPSWKKTSRDSFTQRCADGRFPSIGPARAGDPARARDARPRRPGSRGRARYTPWLRHAAPYPFLPVEGESLHQIPVGPVHAGIIEPGHFRFTANGETVVRLEERLGYVHKGIDALMAGAPLERAARLAGRVSGDSTVAYAMAFARGRGRARHRSPAARFACARSPPSSSVSPTISATSARCATTPPSASCTRPAACSASRCCARRSPASATA